MFFRYRTEGLIIRKEDRGEADYLFVVYTKDFGRLEILGKGIRKIQSKLRSGAEIFYLSEIEFIQGRVYKTLTDAILIDKFENIRKDLERLKIAYQIAEVLDSLIKGQESDEKIWQLLNECFIILNNWKIENSLKIENCKLKIIYYYFLWNLLSFLGYQPQLFNCALCQKKLLPAKLYFSPREGGVICQKCSDRNNVSAGTREAKKIEPEVIKILRLILKRDWDILSRLKIEDSEQKSLKVISSFYLKSKLEEISGDPFSANLAETRSL